MVTKIFIFKSNKSKYSKWYSKIVFNAKKRGWTKKVSFYVEEHHIIPESLGGSNKKYNRVCLTAREHYVCHWLLTKMLSGKAKYKMIHAFMFIKRTGNFNSKNYEFQRKELTQLYKLYHPSKQPGYIPPNLGRKNSKESTEKTRQGNLGKKRTQEQINNISAALIGIKKSKKHKENLSKSRMGVLPWNTGKAWNKNIKEKIRIKNTGKIQSKETIEKKINSQSKNWLLISQTDGKEIIVKNLKQFCKENNIGYSTLILASQNKRKHNKLWKCYKL